jgi:hypothetical protein
MPRGRRRNAGARIVYVDIVLDNGVRWRIDPATRMVQEIEEHAGRAEVRGPAHLTTFIAALDAERRSRHADN